MSSLLALRAYKRRSLTPGGSIAAFAVAFFLVGSGLRGMNLLTFYFISIKATKYKKEIKATIDGTIASNEGSTTRGASQVLACSLVATILSVVHAFFCGAERAIVFDPNSMLSSQLTCGIMAHHATCLADTLASEMGILSKSSPRLITQPWKRVPSGTNGGVTASGFFWSAMGGAIIGVSTLLLDYISGIDGFSVDSESSGMAYALRMILFSLTCGLLGSILDSLLGATIQQSYFDPDTKMVYQEEDNRPKTASLVVSSSVNLLTNELVNLVSVVATTFLGGWVLGPMFF
eukprot:CAMPEP_0197173044 /NCGR_PEP_ID=MMETSP1423-20130617/100_1 /TAXON_ID=476441 /ORGANISM="Pseudo-nitzschia heimii, Strain UNC1101" /LENGTH=289 /DNA_ID=CAMNT_0042621789 /DNA_START=151 /DNA_END=1020 /DNA_ORIENTATION=-